MTNGSRIVFRIVRFFIEARSVPWLHIRTLRGMARLGSPVSFSYPAMALEALLSISQIAVRFIDLVSFQAVVLVCFVTSDSAASRRSQ